MQRAESIEPGRIWPIEFAAVATIAEHGALTVVIDQDHDGACAALPANDYIDPSRFQRCDQRSTVRVVADLADESRGVAAAHNAGRHVGATPAASSRDDGFSVGVDIHGPTETNHNVFHEITDCSEHAQTVLRLVCESFGVDLQKWIETDHASVASRFDAAVAAHVPISRWSETPPGGGSSIAWLLFHMTFHEDLAVNTAIRNHVPLIDEHRAPLGIAHLPRRAGLSETEDRDVTNSLDLTHLQTYVRAVNAGTAEWLQHLSLMAFDSVPGASRRLEHKAGLTPGGLEWLHSMWMDKTVSWFVQWECIGHRHAHLGEMIGIRGRLGLSPF